jgi:hypothetical protein
MPQNPEAELRVCAAGPLMKLLSVGQAEGIPSAVEVRSFLGDKENRKEIIDGVIEDEMIAAWFDMLFCHVEKDYPDDPSGLCDLSFYAVVEEYKLHHSNIVKDVTSFLQKLIDVIPDANEKHALFNQVVSNSKCLTLAHNIILSAVKEHGKWIQKPGEPISPEKMLIKSWKVVEQGKQNWLAVVKAKSKDHEEFLKEPEVLSILYRWGQFNSNDYAEVQQFTDKLTSTDTGMTTFFELWQGNSVNGADLFIGDKKKFVERLDRHPNRALFNEELVQIMTSIEV